MRIVFCALLLLVCVSAVHGSCQVVDSVLSLAERVYGNIHPSHETPTLRALKYINTETDLESLMEQTLVGYNETEASALAALFIERFNAMDSEPTWEGVPLDHPKGQPSNINTEFKQYLRAFVANIRSRAEGRLKHLHLAKVAESAITEATHAMTTLDPETALTRDEKSYVLGDVNLPDNAYGMLSAMVVVLKLARLEQLVDEVYAWYLYRSLSVPHADQVEHTAHGDHIYNDLSIVAMPECVKRAMNSLSLPNFKEVRFFSAKKWTASTELVVGVASPYMNLNARLWGFANRLPLALKYLLRDCKKEGTIRSQVEALLLNFGQLLVVSAIDLEPLSRISMLGKEGVEIGADQFTAKWMDGHAALPALVASVHFQVELWMTQNWR